MILLTIGVVLWVLAHGFKRFFPARRASMGDPGRGMVAMALFVSIVLMIIGYRSAEVIPVYTPIPGMGHLNNLLMLVSVFLFGAGSMKGVVAAKIRHSMLTGMVIWAIAHLLVNGDVASLILFGGLGLWAILQMVLISRAEPWDRPAPGPIRKDLMLVVGTLVLYAVIAGIHILLGHNPFLGTYG